VADSERRLTRIVFMRIAGFEIGGAKINLTLDSSLKFLNGKFVLLGELFERFVFDLSFCPS